MGRRWLAAVVVLAACAVVVPNQVRSAPVEPVHYSVVAGDTWASVGAKYGLTGSQLAVQNGVSTSQTLTAKRVLHVVPGTVTTTTTTTTATTVPATTVPATTSSTTSTTSTSTTSTSTTVAPTTTVPSSGAWIEDFTGNTGLDRFDIGVDFRNTYIGTPAAQWTQPWMADHDMNDPCGTPDTHRLVHPDQVSEVLFVCRDHLMTSLGDGFPPRENDDYGIAFFVPKARFTQVNEVCVDFNLTDMLNREWVEIDIVDDSASNLIVVDWLTAAQGGPAGPNVQGFTAAGGVHAHWNMFGSHKIGINDDMDWREQRGSTDKATRYTTCVINNHNGTATITQNRPGDASVSFTAPATWPTGNVKVVFSQHSYNPNKDGIPPTYTIHWDRVSIT